MKLILAIINLDDVAGVIKHLTKSGFSSTKLTSSGGLLKEGNVTIMTGVSEDRLEEALALINKYSHSRNFEYQVYVHVPRSFVLKHIGIKAE